MSPYLPHYHITILPSGIAQEWTVYYSSYNKADENLRNRGISKNFPNAVRDAFYVLPQNFSYTLTNGVFVENGVRK